MSNTNVEDYEKYVQPSFLFVIAFRRTSLASCKELHKAGLVPGRVSLSMECIWQLEKEQYFAAELLAPVKWKKKKKKRFIFTNFNIHPNPGWNLFAGQVKVIWFSEHNLKGLFLEERKKDVLLGMFRLWD